MNRKREVSKSVLRGRESGRRKYAKKEEGLSSSSFRLEKRRGQVAEGGAINLWYGTAVERKDGMRKRQGFRYEEAASISFSPQFFCRK